ncbi:MAG: hypothetical protein ACHQ50_04645 [Fimbriimonadales bacterium]
MRNLMVLTLSLSLTAASLADGWLLKAPYEANTRLTWNVTINASVGGQDMESKMKQFLSIDSKTGQQFRGKVGWADLQINGGSSPDEPPAWNITLNSNGSIASAGDGPEFVRQLAPTTFLYPDKEVKAGDKWSVKFRVGKDTKEIAADYEVVEQTKIGEADALKIKGKLNEDGGLQSDGVYWLGKDGKVLRFEIDVKNWPVVGAGIPPLDAKIRGELVK